MNLTGKQLIEQGIIFGAAEENIQQHSVDLNVINIHQLTERIIGEIRSKTILSDRIYIPTHYSEPRSTWELEPGVYELLFQQGCKVPKDQRLNIIHRSSLVRNGGMIVGGLFDAGFQTNQIGAMLFLHHPLLIEEGARLATIYATGSNDVDNLYDGQFQNDKQRQK